MRGDVIPTRFGEPMGSLLSPNMSDGSHFHLAAGTRPCVSFFFYLGYMEEGVRQGPDAVGLVSVPVCGVGRV